VVASLPLRGVGVLVTRPVHQAAPLAERVRELGGDPVLFPALAIEPLAGNLERGITAERMANLDLAIFVSPNAARLAAAYIRRAGGLPRALRLAAIGPGTAAELAKAGLNEAGREGVITAPERFDSEALLDMLPVQEVAGRRVAVIRGEGGRELLGRTLEQRGAAVEYIECYRRVRPPGDLGALLPRWRSGGIGASIATSAQIVDNLYAMAGDEGAQWVRGTPMFVPHPRVAAAASRLGTRELVVAGAGDAFLASALETWFGRIRRQPALHSNP
jgi:uroporphyrinogen-III synthase